MTDATAQKIHTAMDLRRQGQTMEQISAVLGVTRAWVGQLLVYGYKLFPEERAAAEVANRGIRFPADPPRIKNFKVVMYKWLRLAGYIRCSRCEAVKDSELFNPAMREKPTARICRECCAIRMLEGYHNNPNIQAWAVEYRKTEKYRKYQRDYHRRTYEGKRGQVS